jgi:hypothetical protein
MMHAQPVRTKILALAHAQKRFSLMPPDEEFFSAGPEDLVQKIAEMTGIPTEEVADCATPMRGRVTIN